MSVERSYPRYPVELAAEVNLRGEVLLAATRNLSRGGVCIDVERPLAEGATLVLSLFLTLEGIEDADTDAINVKAAVVWCSEREDGGYTAGLQFASLAEPEKDRVEEFLARLG
jgi:PilZ domain-containing protein